MKSTMIQKIGFTLLILAAFVYSLYTGNVQKAPVHTNVSTVNTTNDAIELESNATVTLNQYHETHLTAAARKGIFSLLEDKNKYTIAPRTESLLGDCGVSEKVDAIRRLDQQLMMQKVNGSFLVYRTPNDLNWKNVAEAMTYQNDQTLVCGVGFPYPFEVTADHVLWRTTCSSGMLPVDENNKLDRDFVQCLQMEEAIEQRNAT